MTLTLERPIERVILRGDKLLSRVEEATVTATIDLSLDAVSQLVVTYQDPTLTTLNKRVVHKGARLAFDQWEFVVAAIDLGEADGVPRVTVTARSRLAQRLRRDRGPLVQANVSPTTFLERLVRKAGGKFVGQPSPSQKNVARLDASPDAGADAVAESTWDAAVRLAQELGYVVFEDRGTVHFGKPTWLLARGTRRIVRYPTASPQDPREREPLGHVPTVRTSDDDEKHRVTGSVPVAQRHAAEFVPGTRLTLRGVPQFEADYLVRKVSYALDGASPVTVEFETPVDPEPQPPTADVGLGDDGSALAGVDHAHHSHPSTPSGAGRSVSNVTSSAGWIWPTRGRISSHYGTRNGRMHHGIDVAAPTGTRIVAGRGGLVTHAGWADGYGNVVYIDHGGGWTSRYAHMSSVGCSRGQRVSQGQTIGRVGSTGRSSGPHLHFEIRVNGQSRNPYGYLTAAGGSVGSRPA